MPKKNGQPYKHEVCGTRMRYLHRGCRCDACVKAYRDYSTAWERAHGSKPLVLKGHGTAACYARGCRCRPCTDANNARCLESRHRSRKHKGKKPPPELQPCGTPAAYRRGCRCDACKAAESERYRRYHPKRTKRN